MSEELKDDLLSAISFHNGSSDLADAVIDIVDKHLSVETDIVVRAREMIKEYKEDAASINASRSLKSASLFMVCSLENLLIKSGHPLNEGE